MIRNMHVLHCCTYILSAYGPHHRLNGSVMVITIDHHMASERWKDDIAYAMNYIKLISWPIGVWPLQVYNTFSIIRCLWGIFSAVRISSVRYRCSFMFDRSRM